MGLPCTLLHSTTPLRTVLQVYNITHYLRFHPGGVPLLLKVAGKDGTVLFNKYHAWVNYEFMLAKCLVGLLAPPSSTASAAAAAHAVPEAVATAAAPPAAGGASNSSSSTDLQGLRQQQQQHEEHSGSEAYATEEEDEQAAAAAAGNGSRLELQAA